MERIRQGRFERLPPLCLYLNDLEDVVAIIRQVSPTINITTSSHSFDGLEDLRENGPKTFHRLQIASSEPYITLDLQPYKIEIYISDDTPEERGILEQLKSRLLKCRAPLAWTTSNRIGPFVFGATITALVIWVRPLWIASLALLPVLLLLLAGWRLSFNTYATIHLVTRAERPSFWERNKDQILLAIISGVIGAFIALAIQFLSQSNPSS